ISLGTDNAAGNGTGPDPNTTYPTATEYGCAFKGLVTQLQAWAAQNSLQAPTEFEIYNEPDSPGPAGAPDLGHAVECTSEQGLHPAPADNAPWGSSQCGALFYQAAVNQSLNGITLVAGAFNYHSTSGDP